MKYHVIYLWQGEQHVSLRQHDTIKSAREELRAFLADKWVAWIERIN